MERKESIKDVLRRFFKDLQRRGLALGATLVLSLSQHSPTFAATPAEFLQQETSRQSITIKDVLQIGGEILIKQGIEKEIKKNYDKVRREIHKNSQVESIVKMNDLSRISKFFENIKYNGETYFTINPENIHISFLEGNWNSVDLNLLKDIISHSVEISLTQNYNMSKVANIDQIRKIIKEREEIRKESEIKKETIPQPGTLIYGLYEVTNIKVVISEIENQNELISFLGILANLIKSDSLASLGLSSFKEKIIVSSMIVELTDKETGRQISILTFAPAIPIQTINTSFVGVLGALGIMRGKSSQEKNLQNLISSLLAAASNISLVLSASKDPEFIDLQKEYLKLNTDAARREFEEKVKNLIEKIQPSPNPVVGVTETKKAEKKK